MIFCLGSWDLCRERGRLLCLVTPFQAGLSYRTEVPDVGWVWGCCCGPVTLVSLAKIVFPVPFSRTLTNLFTKPGTLPLLR